MPKRAKAKNWKKPPLLDLKVPGLGVGGAKEPDRFRVSSETMSRQLVDALRAMVRDLVVKGELELLRARVQRRITSIQLFQAYKGNVGTLKTLKTALEAEERRLEPLVELWSATLNTRDSAKTVTQVRRFVSWAATQPEGATLEALNSETIALFLDNLTAARHRAAVMPANWQTKNRYRAALSGFCTWLVKPPRPTKKGVPPLPARLATHPIKGKGVRPGTGRRSHRLPNMSPEDYTAYFEGLKSTRPELPESEIPALREQVRVFFRMLIHTGADVGELRTLRVPDVEFGATRADGTVGLTNIRMQRPKTNTEERKVPYPQIYVGELRSYIVGRGLKRGDLLFSLRATKAKSGYILPDVVAAHRLGRKAIGQPELRVKDLRHLAAISWARAGFPIQRISRWLGHSTIQQTLVYENYLPNDSELEYGIAQAADSLAGVEQTQKLRVS